MDFQKYFCPVCKKQFTEDDDVVVCPDCGTAYHRECFKNVGACVNKDKHNSGEEIKEEFISKDYVEKKPKNEEPQKNVVDFKNENKTPAEIMQSLQEQNFADPSTTFLLNGQEAVYYEAALGKNQKYYMPRFMVLSQIEKGASFNFCAFFLPLAWSMYRKMYKLSAIIFAIYFAISGITGYYFLSNEGLVKAANECVQEDPNFYQNIALYTADNGNVKLTVKQQKLLDEINNINIPYAVSILTTVLLIGTRMVMGLFANKKYMEKLNKNIKNAKAKGISGDSLKVFLRKKYGTLPIIVAILIGIFEWTVI